MIIKELKIGSVTLYNFDTEADGSEFYDGVDAEKLAKKYGFSISEVEAEESQRLAIQDVKNAIQTKLDSTAREYDYEDMKSARAWRNTDGYSQNDLVKALTVWAGQCWDKAREVQGLVIQGKREIPTPNEMLELLPTFSFGD